MKEYIKLFNNLQTADGYAIVDIPFTTTVKREEVNLEPQNLRCNEENKQLKREGNIIVIAKNIRGNVISYVSEGGSDASYKISGTEFINSATSHEWNATKQVWELTFENNITEIPERAFYGVNNANSVTKFILPATVTAIGDDAFGYDNEDEDYSHWYGKFTIEFTSQTPPSLEDEHGDPVYLTDPSKYSSGSSGYPDLSIIIPDGTVHTYVNYDSGWELLRPMLLSMSWIYYGTNSNTSLDTNHIAACFGNMFVGHEWMSYNDTGHIQFYMFGDGTDVLPEFLFEQSDVNYIDPDALVGFGAIGTEAFSNCNYLKNITIPSSVTSVGDNAFSGAGIGSITIPSSITSVGNYSFDSKAYNSNTGNYYLNVTINSSIPFSLVDTYGDIIYAFGTVGAGDNSESQSGSGSGSGASKTLNIYVPANAVNTYKNADAGWEYYADYIKAIGS